MRNSIYSITLDEALKVVGGNDTYQHRVLAICCLLCFTVGLSSSGVSFITQKPLLTCESQPCPDVCASPTVQISPDSPKTPATEWGLICGEFPQVQVLWVLYITGVSLGALFFSAFETCFGRRNALLGAGFLGLFSGLVASSAPFIWFLYMSMPLKGAADISVLLTAFLLLLEVTDGGCRNWYLVTLLAAAGFGYTFEYALGQGVAHWRFVMLVPTVLWGCGLPLINYLLESPRYLAAVKGRYHQARFILDQIAVVNRKPHFNDMLEGEKVIGYQENDKGPEPDEAHLSNSSTRDATGKLAFVPITKGIVSVSQGETLHLKRFYYWDLCLQTSSRGVFVVILMLWMSLTLTISSLWDIPGSQVSIAIYGMFLGDLAALVATAYLINKLGRLSLSISYLAIVGLCAILTIAFISPNCHPAGLCTINKVMDILLLHIARLFAKAEIFALGLYTLESFPTAIRCLAIGLIASLSSFIWILNPLFLLGLSGAGFSPMLICGISCLIGSIISCLLTDTSVEELHDYAEEEKEEMKKPAELSQIEIHPSSAEDTSRRLKPIEGGPFHVINEEQSR